MEKAELISIDEAADMLSVNPETLRRWDNDGTLKAMRINNRGDRRWRRHDILTFLQQSNPEAMLTHKSYEIVPDSNGFVPFVNRFGVIAKYAVANRAEKCFTGFVFAAAGLELFKYPSDERPSLEEMAITVMKNYIDNNPINDEDVRTFEFQDGSFIEVFFPEWWEGSKGITLVNGLRVVVTNTTQIKSGVDAWRIIVRFMTKQDNAWLTTTFGPKGNFFEYYVEVSGEYLKKQTDFPPNEKGAQVFALNLVKNLFEQSKDKNGDRSISLIENDKIACWNGHCEVNTYIDIDNLT